MEPKAAMSAEEKKLQELIDSKVKAAVDEDRSKRIDESMKQFLFGGGVPNIQVRRSMADKALETPNMSIGQKAYLAAQRDPDLMESMKALGAIAIVTYRAAGDKRAAADWAKALYPAHESVCNKAVNDYFQKAATVSVPSAGGVTVPMPILEPIIPYLYNRTAVRQLGATVIDLPNGNGRIPRINATSVATYTPEVTAQNATKPTVGDIILNVKKLIATLPISNDLIMSNSVNYEAVVAQDLITIMNIKADYTSIYGSGVANTPLGLVNQVNVQTFGTGSTPLGPDDPFTMVGMLDQANVPMISPGFIINGRTKAWLANLKTSTGAYIFRDEMRDGELANYPFVVSNQLSFNSSTLASDWIFGDWSEYVWGEQTMLELEQSREATYTDENGNQISAFATDATVIRAISRHDFNVKHPVSFVYGTSKLASS